MTSYTPANEPPPPVYPAPPVRHRPLGVTILAILEMLFGILLIIAALGVFVIAGYISTVTIPPDIQQNLPQWFINFAPVFLAVSGVIILVIGIISIMVAWGFLKGRNWARVLAIILLFLSVLVTIFNAIVAAIFTTGALLSLVVSIIIPILLIWYLTTRRVKAWFGVGQYPRPPY
jgi:hypothetical protein